MIDDEHRSHPPPRDIQSWIEALVNERGASGVVDADAMSRMLVDQTRSVCMTDLEGFIAGPSPEAADRTAGKLEETSR